MNKEEIIGKVKELFGAESTKVEMATINAILLQPVDFELEDGVEIVDGLEVSIENGSYSLEDGTTFTVTDGVITDLVSGEVVVEGEEEVIEEDMNNEVKLSEEATDVVEEEVNELEALKAEMKELTDKVNSMESEKVEMSAKIVELSNAPADEEVKIKKSIYTKIDKDDRLMAIRNAMRN